MERNSAAVGAVRRLRTQAPQQHPYHQLQRRHPEKDGEGWHGKKPGAGGCPKLLPEARVSLVLLLYLLGLRVLVHVSFLRLLQLPRDPKEFDAFRARYSAAGLALVLPSRCLRAVAESALGSPGALPPLLRVWKGGRWW